MSEICCDGLAMVEMCICKDVNQTCKPFEKFIWIVEVEPRL